MCLSKLSEFLERECINVTDCFFFELEINLSRNLKVPTIRDTDDKFEQVDSVWADANIDGNTDTSVIGDTLKQMVYLEAFVKEVLRFHPPVQFINRECSKKVKVCGYDIPAGTGVSFFSFFVLMPARVGPTINQSCVYQTFSFVFELISESWNGTVNTTSNTQSILEV